MNRNKISILLATTEKASGDRVCKYMNQQEDMEVIDQCNNGIELLRMIGNQQPDVIVMDLILAGLDGIGVLEKMQVEFEGSERPEVIVVTAMESQRMVECACELGVAYYMIKPYEIEILWNRVRQVSKGKITDASTTRLVKNLVLEEKNAGEIIISYHC